jgi:hypothetical protein
MSTLETDSIAGFQKRPDLFQAQFLVCFQPDDQSPACWIAPAFQAHPV